MALEDFFTLTEVNDGLSDPDRVKVLVGLLQKGTDHVINNVSDATRQWSAVARAISGTKNIDCLLLFVQLDGLIYVNRWLKGASGFENKTTDCCVEDTLVNLLEALTRIEADSDQLDTSGILITLKDLLGHNNPQARDMAKCLLDKWNKENTKEIAPEGEDTGKLDNADRGVSECQAGKNGNLGPSIGDIDASQGSLTSEIQQEMAKGDLLSTASESLKDEEIQKTSPDVAIYNQDIPYSTNTRPFQGPVNANLDKLEPSISCAEEPTSMETCSSVIQQDIQKEEINDMELDPTRTDILTQKMCSSLQIPDNEQDPEVTLNTNEAETLPPVIKLSDIKDDNAEGKDCVGEVSDCLKTAASKAEKKMNDDKSSGNDRNIMDFRMNSGGEQNNDVLGVSNTSELNPKDFKGRVGLFGRPWNLGISEGRSHGNVEDCSTKDYDFSKQKNRKKDIAIEIKSDFDLDYGLTDPLELARLVANEVEREVEDRSRELSCSSSEKEMSSKLQRLESSHSVTGEQCQVESLAAKVSTQSDVSLDLPTREDDVTSARSLDPGSQEARSPQVTEGAQVVEASSVELVCHFDLNQDVSLADVELHGDTTSPPVSIVSASRAGAPLMPDGPLQLEGALGGKGSAATSALQPASLCGVPESDFTLSAGGSNSSSKENHSILNIDLNVAESEDDKEIPESIQFASLESSAEASSRRPERLDFDLNQLSDDGAPLYPQTEQDIFHQRSGNHNHSSSSSSSKQPSQRNIDLNDQPTVANDLSSGHFYGKPSECFSESDDSVISIMGMRVEVNRRNSSVKAVQLSNKRIPGPTIGFNLERPGLLAMGSPNPHIFGLSGLPPGSSTPFLSPMYGSSGAVPYMVDLREAPVVPQIVPSSAISTAFPQPPYLFSMPGMPSANGIALPSDSLYPNSGIYTEGSSRDVRGSRQLFSRPQAWSFDEQVMTNSQPSTSLGIGIGGKRKEPESGWESDPFKHRRQPWR